MCNLVFLFCSLRCSSVYLVFYCNMFGEALSACLPTALNASSGWSCVSYAWEFWAMILLKVFSVPLSYLSSYSFPTEISKFSFTSEIMRLLSALSYCFFFSCLFQLSCLQVLMLYLLLSWSNLYAKVFFITRISIWLFYISLYWIHHSFSCVVFNISLSSLLFIPFWVIEDFVPLWLLEHSFNPSLPLIVWDFIYFYSLEPSLWSCWILIFIALVFLHWTLYILDYFHWFIL